MPGTPECDNDIRKGHRKDVDALIQVPEIQEEQREEISADNQYHRSNPFPPPCGDRFAEIDQNITKPPKKACEITKYKA